MHVGHVPGLLECVQYLFMVYVSLPIPTPGTGSDRSDKGRWGPGPCTFRASQRVQGGCDIGCIMEKMWDTGLKGEQGLDLGCLHDRSLVPRVMGREGKA